MGMICCLWVFDCCLEEIPVIKEDAATLLNPDGVYLIFNNKYIFYGQ